MTSETTLSLLQALCAMNLPIEDEMSDKWKLERFGKTVEEHSTKEPCIVAAMERGWVLDASADFIGDAPDRYLAEGVKITGPNAGTNSP